MSRLKTLIQKRGLKQKEVARLAKTSISAVNHLCRKGVRTVRVAKIYAPLLQCHPLDLIEI